LNLCAFSGNQPEFLAQLDRLRSAFRAQLVEGTAAMRLNRVLAYVQAIRNLAIAEAGGNQPQDFDFACRDA
jgi:hypothetical protein